MTRTATTALAAAGLTVSAIAAALVPLSAQAVERYYSAGLYPPVQRVLTWCSNQVPFALLDVLLLALVAALAFAVRVWRRAGRRRAASAASAGLAAIAVGAALCLAFLILWGFNYRRVPMFERIEASTAAPAAQAVTALGREAAGELNRLFDEAHRRGWRDDDWRGGPLRDAFLRVQAALTDAPPITPGRRKASLIGPYLRWASVDGMVNPFGLEVITNPDLLPFERPFVTAHEWGHLAGFADESEANFIGWLACLGGDAATQYSGWQFLYWQVYAESDATTRQALAALLAPGPRRDLEAITARVARGRWAPVQSAGWAVYDRYLKANRVERGIRSYSAVLDLITRARLSADRLPVRRR